MVEFVTLTQALDSLTLLRYIADTNPMLCLRDLCASIAANDFDNAVSDYCALTSTLLEEYRRVTGDIWKDFIFYIMIEHSNRFAVCYAKQRADHALEQAMACDLLLMQQLFALSSAKVLERIGEIPKRKQQAQEKRQQAHRQETIRGEGDRTQKPPKEEAIKGLGSSAWAGISLKEITAKRVAAEPFGDRFEEPEEHNEPVVVKTKEQMRLENMLVWQYDEPAIHKPYASDAKLALLYRLFIATEDWKLLVDPLKSFYSTYGSGQFLRYRTFIASDEGLLGVDKFCDLAWEDLCDDKSRKSIIYDNINNLIMGAGFQNMLLYGNGRGKTTAIEAICEQIEELRLVYVNCKSIEKAVQFVQLLADQPLKFVVLMDDLALRDFEYRKLKGSFAALSAQNILLCATAKTKLYDDSFFTLNIEFDAEVEL